MLTGTVSSIYDASYWLIPQSCWQTNLSPAVRSLGVMNIHSSNQQTTSKALDPHPALVFADPVSYMAQYGIEVEVIFTTEVALEAA